MIENSDDGREINPKVLKAAAENTIIKELTHKHYEKWEVTQLVDEPESISKPTPLIEKLNENRKQKHEYLLAKLAQDLNDVNTEIESNMRTSSEEIKAQVHSYKQKLNDILTSINNPEIAYYCRPIFHNIQLQAEQMRSEQLNLVNELYEELLRLENERMKKNEKIFTATCEEICKNGFMLPYDLQCFTEQEILKMDQLVLNNRRCYEDLRFKLTLITVETFKAFVDKMFCAKEKWVRHEMQEAHKQMMEEMEEKIDEDIKPISRLELKGEELIIDLTPKGLYNSCEVKNWIANINSVVNKVEKHGTNLIEMYKKMLDVVFFNFSNKVDNVRKELNEMEVLEFEERIMQPIMFQAQNDKSGDVEMLEAYWQETLNEIRITINNVVEFLFATRKLWDRHYERVEESEKKILTDWEKATKENKLAMQDLENKLNTASDNLRQEYEKCKLEKLYCDVLSLLGDIKLKYEGNHTDEVNIIEEFYDLMKVEADVLSSEIKEFLHSHPLEALNNNKKNFIESNNCHGNKFIHTQIKICLARVKKIPAWKQGVWKALEGFSQNTVDSLKKQAEPWVTLKLEEISGKIHSQLDKHSRRYDKIRTGVYETRIRELNEHSLIFEKHKADVDQKQRIMKLKLKILIEKQADGLNKLEEFCFATEEKIKTDYRSGVIACLQIQAEKRKSEYGRKIADAYNEFLRECETRLTSVKECNVDFVNSLKPFSEGGNYNADEIKFFVGELEMIDKNFQSELKNIEAELKQSENELIKTAEELLSPVIKTICWVFDELQFNDVVLTEISKYTKIIQDIALHTKSDYIYLKSQCEKMFDALRNPDHAFTKQDSCWFSIVRTVYKNISNIFYPVRLPEEFEEVLEDPTCSDDVDFSTKATISVTDTLPSFKKDNGFVCKDYKQELFNSKSPPENDFTFMAVTCNKLWGYMDNLQRIACIFYRKLNGREIVRGDLILGSYDLFAENMLMKLQYYNVQCEQLWLSIMQEFLPLLTQLKQIFNKYVERKIWDVETKTINEIINHHQEFMRNMNEFLKETDCELKKLDDKLLTLHGHPNNQNLLNELEDELVSTTATLEANWESLIATYKAELINFQDYHIKNESEMKEIEESCVQIKKAIFIDDFGAKLLNTILKYTERGGYFIKRHSKNFKQPPAPPSTPTEAFSEVPSSHDLNLFPLGTETQTVQMHLLELEDLLYSDSETKLNLLVESVNSEELIKNSLKSIEDFLKELFWIADTQKNVLEEKIFKWIEIWKCNVKKIQKLYDVKYSAQQGELKGLSLDEAQKIFLVLVM